MWAWALLLVVVLIGSGLFAPAPTLAANGDLNARWMTNGSVSSTVIDANGDTFVGGDFTTIGPATGGGAALSTGGTGTSASLYSQPGVAGTVHAVEPDGSGGFFIGGSFTAVGGAARANIAHVQADGSVDAAWNPGGVGANGTVRTLALSGGFLFAGGEFTSMGGVARTRLAKIDATGSGTVNASWVAGGGGVDNTVNAVAIIGSDLYVVGSFLNVLPSYTGRWRAAKFATGGTGTLDPTWNPAPNSVATSLVAAGTSLYVGGTFGSVGGQSRTCLAKLDTSTGAADPSWNPGGTVTNVAALAASGSDLYVGGQFSTIGGQPRSNVAKLDAGGTGTANASWNPGVSGAGATVTALAVSGTSLYVGGAFTTAGGQARSNLAKLDAATTGSADPTWNPGGTGTNGQVHALATSGSVLYAGGAFATIGAEARNRIAKLTTSGTGAVDPTWNPGGAGANAAVTTLAVSGDSLYAGGSFTTMGGITRTRLAKLDASGSGATDPLWVAGGGGLDNTVNAIVVHRGNLYAVGSFLNVLPSYTGRWRAAKFSATGAGALDTNWNPAPNNVPFAMVATSNGIYVGGQFNSVGGQTRQRLALLDADGAGLANTTWDPGSGSSITAVTALAFTGTSLYVGGTFTNVGGQARANVAKLAATGTGAADSGWNPGTNGAVTALALAGNTLYAGGSFTTIGGQSRTNVAKLDGIGSGAVDTSWGGTGTDAAVNALDATGSRLVAGGAFSKLTDRPASVAQFEVDAPMSIDSGPRILQAQRQTTVYWHSSSTGSSELRWDTTAAPWSTMANDVSNTTTTLGTLHSRTISNLAPGTYYLRVRTSGAAGTATSGARRLVVQAANASLPASSVVADATITSSATSSDGATQYIGGNFTRVGMRSPSAALVDGTSGTALLSGQPMQNGTVMASVPDGSGGWFIGGSFTLVGGKGVDYLAHLLPDGGLDPYFDHDLSARVRTLVVSGGVLYAGGDFTTADGVTRNRGLAIDIATDTLTSWNPNANASICALVLNGSTMYAGGSFTTVSASSRPRLAALNLTTGAPSAWTPNVTNGVVYALATSGSNVYAGGDFTTVNGSTTRNRLASFDTTSGTANAWDPNVTGTVVNALEISGSNLYAGGAFTTVNGATTRSNAAAFPSTGTATATAWNPAPDGTVRALTASGTNMYVGGSFNTIASTTRRAAASITTAGAGAINAWDPSINLNLYSIAVDGPRTMIGGDFVGLNMVARTRLAAIDIASDTITSLNVAVNNTIWAMATTSTGLYIGGDFTNVGGSTRNKLAMITTPANTLATWNPNITGGTTTAVYAIAVNGTVIHFGGAFTAVGGTARTNAAAMNTAGTLQAWAPSPNNSIFSMALSGSTMYLAGAFTQVNATAGRTYLTAVNASAASAANATWSNVPNGPVRDIVLDGTRVIAAGSFTSVGATTRNYAAAFSATGTLDATWNPNLTGGTSVETVELLGSNVYFGGDFTAVGGQARANLAQVAASGTGAAGEWNPGPNSTVFSLDAAGGRLFVGGAFNTAGGRTTGTLASFQMTSNGTRGDAAGISIVPGSVHVQYRFGQHTVTWDTDVSGSSELVWGRINYTDWENYPYDISNTDTNLGTVHSRTISNLQPGRYLFKVRSRTAGGAQVTSTTYRIDVDQSDATDPLSNLVAGGKVNASAMSADGSTMYIGGTFTSLGERTGTGLRVDPTSGAADPGAAQVAGTTYVSVPDGSGGYYIGGSFDMVGAYRRMSLAHILPDGGVDPDWNPATNGEVQSLHLNGTTLYVGGDFTTIGGQSRSNVAALDVTQNTNNATSWNPGANGVVNAMALNGTTLYIGGSFTTAGGATRSNVAALNTASNTATTWNPSASGIVHAMVYSASVVYVGGEFTTAGGSTRNRIAGLNAGSNTATSWNPNADGTVFALTLSGANMYIGGEFANIGGAARNYAAVVPIASNTATAFNAALVGDDVRAIAIDGSTAYLGGNIVRAASTTDRENIVAVDATSGAMNTSFDAAASSTVETIQVGTGNVFVGGWFASINVAVRHRIAAIDAVSGEMTAFNPDANGTVWTMARTGSTLFFGGVFNTVGGSTRTRLAAVDLGTGALTSWNPTADGTVLTMDTNGSTVYVGGLFANAGGSARSRVAAIPVGSNTATAWNPGANAEVDTFLLDGTTLYAGGLFTTIGGQARAGIAALDTTVNTNNATTWNPGSNGSITTMALDGTTLYAGGAFTTIGGASRTNVAALDTTTPTSNATSWNPNPNGTVTALAVAGDTVFVGGNFTSMGGQSRTRLVGVAKASGAPLATNFAISSTPMTIVVRGSVLYVGGDFGLVDNSDISQAGFAMFDLCDRTGFCDNENLRDYIVVSLDSPTVDLTATVGSSVTATTTMSVRSNAMHGYSIVATDASDTVGLSCSTGPCAGQSVTDWTGTPAAPTTWASADTGTEYGFGVSVLSSPSKLAKWGTGTAATDFANNKYAGLARNTDTTLYSTNRYTGLGIDTSVLAWRLRISGTQRAGSYEGAVTFTALPNP